MPPSVTSPRLRVGRFPLGALPLTLLATLGSLLLTGAVSPPALLDPGPVVRWGLPATTLLTRLATVVAIGAFVLCAVVLPHPARPPRSGAPTAARGRSAWEVTALVGMVAAVAWALAQLANLLLTHAAALGAPIGGADYGVQLYQFVTGIDLGRYRAWATLLAALVALVSAGVAGYVSAGWAALLAFVALIPVAATGHAAGSANHDLAVAAWWVHLVGVTVWVGGLSMLCLVASRLDTTSLSGVLRRYSSLAGWAFALTVAAGAVSGWLRLSSPWDLLLHPYGQLLLAKVVLATALGLAGLAHRRLTIPAIQARAGTASAGAGRAFWRLAGVEVLIMGAVVGISVALGISPPPAPEEAAASGTVYALTGYLEPPPPTVGTYLTQWSLEPVTFTALAAALVAYLRWVTRLRRRGHAWPALRTVAWVAGLVLLLWATNGGPAVYGRVLFSGLMLQTVLIALIAPTMLVLAQPVTVALRALPAREDGSRGPREWLVALTRRTAPLTHPAVAVVLYTASWAALCFTPLLDLVLTGQVAKLLTLAWFPLVGCLLASAMIGEPAARHPRHFVAIFATMAFHTALGIALSTRSAALAPDFFHQLGLSWGADALSDQAASGLLTWAAGAGVTLLLGLVTLARWAHQDPQQPQGSAPDRGAVA